MSAQTTCLIKTASCYVAVLDKASPAWVTGLFEEDLGRGKAMAKAEGMPEALGLFGFNTVLEDRAARGELLAWTLLFDGVYKASIAVSVNPARTEVEQNMGAEEQVADLHFPTGQVMIACLSKTGDNTIEPVLRVQPGRYRVRFLRHKCEDDHAFLERDSDYPPQHGPDWTITLSRLADEPPNSPRPTALPNSPK